MTKDNLKAIVVATLACLAVLAFMYGLSILDNEYIACKVSQEFVRCDNGLKYIVLRNENTYAENK